MDILELSKKIKQGSEEHFEMFFNQTCGIVYNVSLKMGFSREDSEEIVQDTYMQFWRQRNRLRLDENPIGLLKIIAKRLVYRRMNTEKPDVRANDHIETISWVDEQNKLRVNTSLLKHNINFLPNTQKSVLELYYFRGFDVLEISSFMNVSRRTVENNLYRAKKNLRLIIKEGKGLFSIYTNE